MAVASTSNTFQGTDLFRTDVIANAASNVAITIAHGLGAIKAAAGAGIAGLAPLIVTLTDLTAVGNTSGWFLTSINTTNVVLGRTTTSATQSATPQVRVHVQRPHSIGR
jgi:hypothetical protein